MDWQPDRASTICSTQQVASLEGTPRANAQSKDSPHDRDEVARQTAGSLAAAPRCPRHSSGGSPRPSKRTVVHLDARWTAVALASTATCLCRLCCSLGL